MQQKQPDTSHFPDDGPKRFVYRSAFPTGHVIVSRNLAPATDPRIAQSLETVFKSMPDREREREWPQT